MKKIISSLLALTLAVTLFSEYRIQTSAASNANDKPKVIRIASIVGTISTIAKKQGFFEKEFSKEGIKVEYQEFSAGPSINEGFISDKLDFATYGDQPAIVAAASGAGIKAVGTFTGGYDKFALVAPPDSDIKSAKDLKGKKVGITVGTVVQNMLEIYLDSVGLTSKDVSIVNLQPNDIATSLAAKNIDAAVTVEPFTTVILAKKAGKIVADSKGLKYMGGPIVVTNKFAQRYPKIVQRVLKVYDTAKKWETQNKDKAADTFAKELKIPKGIALAGIVSKDTTNVKITNDVVSTFKQTYKFLKTNNFIKKDYDIKQFYDIKFLKAAKLQ